MSSKYNIGVALKKSIHVNDVLNKVLKDFKSYQHEEGTLYLVDWIRWNDGPCVDLVRFYEELSRYPAEDYLVVCACHAYPTSEDGDAGAWEENPWQMCREIDASIYSYCPKEGV